MSSLGDEISVLEGGPLIWALDDDDEILGMLGRLMDEAGYRYRGFVSPSAMREQLELSDEVELPALLILDWMIPETAGSEVMRWLANSVRWAQRPIIVLTALTGESVLINAFESGADDVVRKPFSVSELLARIRHQLNNRKTLTRLRRTKGELQVLMELSREFDEMEGVGAVLERLGELLARTLGMSRGRIFLQHEQRQDLRDVLSDASLHLSRLPELGEAIAAREIVELEAGDMARLGLMEANGEAGVVAPLSVEDAFLGVVLLSGPASRIGGMTPHRRRLMELAARMSARAIQRAQLIKRLREQRAQSEAREFELRRTRDFLTHVIEASPDAVVAADAVGEIVLFNAAAEQILGRSRVEAIGSDVRTLYPEGVAEQIMARMRSSTDGPPGVIEPTRVELVAASGTHIPVDIAAAILHAHGDEIGSVGVFTDLRERLQIEEQLQQVTEDLEQSRQRVMMAELAGATAHELNQPLTSLLNYAELLADAPYTEERHQRAAQVIVKEVEQIAEIVRKLGQITQYRTRDYVGKARIVDFGEES